MYTYRQTHHLVHLASSSIGFLGISDLAQHRPATLGSAPLTDLQYIHIGEVSATAASACPYLRRLRYDSYR